MIQKFTAVPMSTPVQITKAYAFALFNLIVSQISQGSKIII
jgi:hypothetical protein